MGIFKSSSGGIVKSSGGGLSGAAGTAAETLIQSFTLTNTEASTTQVLARFGLPFKDGDCPSGSTIVIRRNSDNSLVDSYQFDRRVTWSSGALKNTICHMRDETDITTGSPTRVYDVYVTSGSFSNTAWDTHANILSDITTNSDWTGTFSSHSQPVQSDTTNHVFSLNTALGTAESVTITHKGDVCYGGYATQIKNGEIVGTWYFDVWNDGTDASNGNIECALKLGLPLWDVANKDRHDYTLTFKEDTTTKDTYTVNHVYHSEWITVRDDNDNMAGRRHWQTDSQRPTLIYKPDKSYWVTTKVVPPYDVSLTPTAFSSSYTNYSAPTTSSGNFDHRAAIDGTGDYQGRGLIPWSDVCSFLRQGASDYKSSRINAFAGLHIGYHFRSSATRLRTSFDDGGYNDYTGESSAQGFTLLSLTMNQAASDDFTADGLPADTHGYRGGDTTSKAGYTTYTGGNGVWTLGDGASHDVNWTQFMYLLEGEPYFYDCMLDISVSMLHRSNGNVYIGRPNLLDYGRRGTAWLMPSTRYDAVYVSQISNSRGNGWAFMNHGVGWGLCADNDQHKNYFDTLTSNTGDFMATSLSYFPTAHKNRGLLYERNNAMEAPYFQYFITLGMAYFYGLTENSDIGAALGYHTNFALERWNSGSYAMAAYRTTNATQLTDWDNEADLHPTGETWLSIPIETPTTLVAATDKITENHLFGGSYTDGDEFYFYTFSGEGAASTIPSEVSASTIYDIYNATAGTDFQITTSGGSSAIDFGTDTSVAIAVKLSGVDKATNQAGGWDDVIGDKTWCMGYAALCIAKHVGVTAVTSQNITDMETFINGASFAGFPQWAFDGAIS